ncbi:hypothetical protein TELCIR_09406 [Teladorsagia circumcincta]|uniref:Uncharacterized protein n=1 Tax=Teladorsagia circumcincta TaxID=45464 RepID=A0A2G9UEZ6_TELCI|nr:hypothetical protein TELCIR_09406 [Teladorsagia circumcincta]
MCHIDNDLADELLKIEDVYGERRKESSEKTVIPADPRDSIKPLMSEPSSFGHGGGRGAPVSFFPPPARGVSAFGPGGYPGANAGVNGMIDVGAGARGRGMGRGFPPSSFPRDGPRGRGRGSFGGRGGMRGHGDKPSMNSSHESTESQDENQRFEPPRSPEPEAQPANSKLRPSRNGLKVQCSNAEEADKHRERLRRIDQRTQPDNEENLEKRCENKAVYPGVANTYREGEDVQPSWRFAHCDVIKYSNSQLEPSVCTVLAK